MPEIKVYYSEAVYKALMNHEPMARYIRDAVIEKLKADGEELKYP